MTSGSQLFKSLGWVGMSLLALSFSPFASAHSQPETHLWTEDHAAYRSYRVLPDAPLSPRSLARLSRSDLFSIDPQYLIDSLKILTGSQSPEMGNRGQARGKLSARQFLRQEFEAMGYQVSEHAYRSGVNLVAEKAGPSGKFLVVSAHYDSVNNAGADDDATEVIGLLGTAAILKTRPLQHGIRFVAFDEEEVGLVGSRAYAKHLVDSGEKPSILGVMQLEMMGYNRRNDGKFHVISCDREDSQFMVDAFRESVRTLGNGLQITTACTDRSDHASFWRQGIPAVVSSENFFGGDSNPCYHRSCDTIPNMHLDYFVKVAEAAANAALLIVAQ